MLKHLGLSRSVCLMRFIMLIPLLSGCTLYAEYEHHSAALTQRDINTADQVGFIVSFPLTTHSYSPELEMGLSVELDNYPVFGPDPIATIRVRQPIFKKKRQGAHE